MWWLILLVFLIGTISCESTEETLMLKKAMDEASKLMMEHISGQLLEGSTATKPISRCQIDLSGFHGKPSPQILEQSLKAQYLEMVSLKLLKMSEEKGDNFHVMKKRQTFDGDVFSRFFSAKTLDTRLISNNRFSSNSDRFNVPNRELTPSLQVAGNSGLFKTDKPLSSQEINRILSDALSKLSKDIESGLTTNTKLVLPQVNLIKTTTKEEVKDEVAKAKSTTEETKQTFEKCGEKVIVEDCSADSIYRTFSGRCNNLNSNSLTRLVEDSPLELFGRSNSLLERILPPEYGDTIGSPRRESVLSGLLPTARQVSNAIHAARPEDNQLDQKYTLALMQWGQYLDHDLTSTPIIRGLNNSILDCSSCLKLPYGCDPIQIKEDDPYFSPSGKKCIPFTRSLPGQSKFGPRQQINQITAFIDASSVYGSDFCHSEGLRNGSWLSGTAHPLSPGVFKNLLPTAHYEECTSKNKKCFKAGDDRISEQPGLSALHTIFQREHNRLAFQLTAINPHWDADKIFQESRKIVIASHQHITFNEFLPRVLGPQVMSDFGLNLSELYFDGYDDKCNPNMFNEFATAAFRFGHTLVRPDFSLMSRRQEKGQIRLRDHFHNADALLNQVLFIDELTSGLVSKPMSKYDSKVTPELTNHLFEEHEKPFSGMDLAALNIHRGRDHGIPGYSKYVRWCSNRFKNLYKVKKVDSFLDLKNLTSRHMAIKLSKLYRHVDDIDLFTGALSETPLDGALVGPTFGCIIGLQFKKLRRCDRFWYETPDQRIGFNAEQLQQIKNETFAAVLCRNSDDPSQIQRMAFDLESPDRNPLVECKELFHMDLMKWKSRDEREKIGKSVKDSNDLHPPYCDLKGKLMSMGSTRRVSACVECTCSSNKVGDEQCSSIVVSSCAELLAEVGPEAIRVDPACQTQCPHLMS